MSYKPNLYQEFAGIEGKCRNLSSKWASVNLTFILRVGIFGLLISFKLWKYMVKFAVIGEPVSRGTNSLNNGSGNLICETGNKFTLAGKVS